MDGPRRYSTQTSMASLAAKRPLVAVPDSMTTCVRTMMLVSHIYPPELEFLGPKTRLGPLADPEKDRRYAVEGWLYGGDNMFYVAAVKPLGD